MTRLIISIGVVLAGMPLLGGCEHETVVHEREQPVVKEREVVHEREPVIIEKDREARDNSVEVKTRVDER